MRSQAIQLSLVAAVVFAAAAVYQSQSDDAAQTVATDSASGTAHNGSTPFVQSHIGTLPDGQLRAEAPFTANLRRD